MLEKIPFPIGYGVETSHILDVYRDWGLDAFGQTDLDQRIHRNQETLALGKMSFGILQSFLGRMDKMNKDVNMPELSQLLRQFQARDSDYEQVVYEIIEEERPPMDSIPAYREKYGLPPLELKLD